MASRGTRIEGWWVWWPCSGAVYGRVFASEEDARAFLPAIANKKGEDKTPPLGSKYIMRVVWDYENNRWSNDEPDVIPQSHVWAQFKELEANK